MRTVVGGVSLCLIAGLAGCAGDISARVTPPRGTLGEQIYGVLCDRIGAGALPEDLTGGSYAGICHRDPTTHQFADAVDATQLPTPPDTKEVAARAADVARVQAMVPRRADLIAAFDAMIPATATVTTRDAAGSDACAAGETAPLASEVASFMGRLGPSYDDGTIPEGTRSIARVVQAVESSPDALAALGRLGAHAGYRQEDLALGALRPALAYPNLRDVLVNLSRLLSIDSQPGASPAVAGPLVPLLDALVTTGAWEAQTATADPPLAPLSTAANAALGLSTLSRPRSFLELLANVVTHEDAAFGSGTSRPIARRDVRGMASVALVNGQIPAPFVDADGDGLADIDGSGYFVTTDGSDAPAPFLPPWTADGTTRDAFGRAIGPSGAPYYATFDATQTYAAALSRTLLPLLNPDVAAQHETLMDALAGAYVVLGGRTGAGTTTKAYALPSGQATSVTYDAFDTTKSPALDLLYAGGQLVADSSADALLDEAAWLMANEQPLVAELANAGFATKATWDATPAASLPATSTLPDEILDVAAQIAQVRDADGSPGLLNDVLAALADPATSGLGGLFASLATNKDLVDYNRNDIDGPPMNVSTGVLGAPPSTPTDWSQPITGSNRSLFYRFLQLIHDARGVSICNKDGATVKAVLRVPVVGNVSLSIPDSPLVTAFWGKTSFAECEVFKMDDAALFYVESIVGRAEYVIRDPQLRNGVTIDLGVTTVPVSATATTVQVLQDSSGLTGYQPPGTSDPSLRTGFWTAPSSTQLMTRPEWLNRGLFMPNGVGAATVPSFQQTFAAALNPPHAGTSVCPTRAVNDPLPASDPNYTPGGVIHLPSCADGDWLDQRDAQTIFALETDGFYAALAPLVTPFTNRGRADLLVSLLDALYKHWPGTDASAAECKLDALGGTCTREGAVHFEPVLATAFANATPALAAIGTAFTRASAPSFDLPCATRDASGTCAAASVSGTRVLAEVAAQALDPNEARRRGLTDRQGNTTALRNDGTTNPQVTPVYLLAEALAEIDAAFSTWAAAHPSDTGRKAQWLRARSQLVDQVFSVHQTAGAWAFDDAALPAITPTLATTLRQQLWARCPEWPNQACAWAGITLASRAAQTLGGPLFAQTADLADALRADDGARTQVESLAQYLLDASSGNLALPSLLASSNDVVQWLDDDANLVPLLNALGVGLAPEPGHRSFVDAQLALLSRLTERVTDSAGDELCGREVDPNQVLTVLLQGLATPASLPSGSTATPLEVFGQVITDVNRLVPASNDAVTAPDLGAIARQTVSFLTDETNGLEQFYAVVKNATE